MFGFISRNILTGIITLLPIVLTVYLLYWLAITAENLLGDLLRIVLPSGFYYPGMGVFAGFVVIFFIGLLMHAYVFQAFVKFIEQVMFRLPLIKPVYRIMKDFFDYFAPKKGRDYDQVVSVKLNDQGMQTIGFITQTDLDTLPNGFNQSDSVLVYLPLSYMIGGYTLLVPKTSIQPVDMSMEEAMRFVLTAGVNNPVANNKAHLFKNNTTKAPDVETVNATTSDKVNVAKPEQS